MFAQFLDIIFKSLKLDKSLYSDSRYFGEAAIYFAGLIMILDGVAGAVAANTIVKTSIGISGLTAILTWLVWAHTNHVNIAVRPEIPMDVFTIVFAATAPATPSRIIIRPAK